MPAGTSEHLGHSADLIIIGAGPGGYHAAELASKAGLQVIIVERAHLGGTCLNEGCIPTKCYARHAEVLSLVREAATFGISLNGTPEFDLAQACNRKESVISQLRAGIATLLDHPNITIVEGDARFVDAHTIAVGSDQYTAPNLIIATGSKAKTLRLQQPSTRRLLDSSDLLQLTTLPRRLCIVGAGVIGMEFASIFSTFGTEVTVVEFLKECLPALDCDIAKRLRKSLEHRGVNFCMQSAVTAITDQGVTYTDKRGKEHTVEADEVLMAVGRTPRLIDDLALTGIDYDERTGIHVDEHMQTNVPGIYAIGDVNGRQMLAHAAEAQAKVAVSHILQPHPTSAHDSSAPIPAAIFTRPEAACVGQSEEELKASGKPYECRKAFHRANGKALAMNESDGMLKLLSEPEGGRILGCHVYGAHAADLVQEVSVLMCRETSICQLQQMVHIHPTLSEIVLSAACS